VAREVTLNDPAAVRFIQQHFVPWAGENGKLFYSQNPAGELRQWATRWGLKPGNSTSYQVVSPDGKRVAVWDTSMSPSIHFGRHLVAFLDKALQKTGKAPPRKIAKVAGVTRDRGVGLRKDKTAKLAVTTRRPDEKDKGLMVASLVLSVKQLNALRPPKAKVGQRYVLPKDVSRYFAKVCVHADSLFAVKPDEATEHQMNAEVTRVDKDVVEVVFRGELGIKTNGKLERMLGQGKGKAQGRLRFNKVGELQELLLVYKGHFHNWYSRSWDPEYTVQGMIEWRRE
jgi:hypothetical protein